MGLPGRFDECTNNGLEGYAVTMPLLQIYLLGKFQVMLAGQPITAFSTDKTRALLAYLVMEQSRAHLREELAGLLWSDQPEERAMHNLRQALSILRKALPDPPHAPPFLLITPETARFNPQSEHWLDVSAFTQELTAAIGKPPSIRPNILRLQQALALYAGAFLCTLRMDDGVLLDDWVLLEREGLNQRAVAALDILTEYHERRGEFTQALEYAERLAALAPWDETAHTRAMLLLAAQGQFSAALTRYQSLRRYLRREMCLEPAPETAAIHEQIRRAAATQTVPSPRYPPPKTNLLPIASPFFGRQTELAELANLLANPSTRLITLFGPGGIGKTRLAQECAAAQVGIFPDGVWFVPLASLHSSSQLAPAIAEAMQLSITIPGDLTTHLLDFLRNKHALLVLDNFEHIANAGELVTQISQAAPQVLILITSRVRLHLYQEIVFHIDGLKYPDDAEALLAAPAHYPAVELILAGIRRLQRSYTLSSADAPALVNICRALEGLPLGLELAGAATWSRSLPHIAQELTRSLETLSVNFPDLPPRHRSLQAAFDHSWALLDSSLQAAFASLSIFYGGFEAVAAQEIAAASPEILQALLDRSLVRRQAVRWDLPEPLRPFAQQALAQDPARQAALRKAHAAWYLTLLASGQNIAPERENIHRAWLWAVEYDLPQLVEPAVHAMYQFYQVHNLYEEARELLEAALRRWEGIPNLQSFHASLQARLSVFYERQGRTHEAVQLLESSLAATSVESMPAEHIFSLTRLANILHKRGDNPLSVTYARRALELAHQLDNASLISSASYVLARILSETGEMQQARTLAAQSLEYARAAGSPQQVMTPLNLLGDLACHDANWQAAIQIFEECLDISRSLGSLYHISIHLNNLGTTYHMLKEYPAATRYYTESLALCQQIGDRDGQAVALSNLGEISALQGAYSAARQYYAGALELGRQIESAWLVTITEANLGEIELALAEWNLAASHFHQALAFAWNAQLMVLVMKALTGFIATLVEQNQPELAAQVLAVVLVNSSTEPDDLERARQRQQRYSLPRVAPPDLASLVQRLLTA